MPDVQIFQWGNLGNGYIGFNTGIIWDRDNLVGYQFQDEESPNFLTVKKTIDGGATFAASIASGGAGAAYMAVWPDWWTPGGTGTLIHIAAGNGPSVNYYEFDTSDDTWRDTGIGAGLSGPVGSQSDHAMRTMTLSITKAIGGEVYICANARNDTENLQGSDMSSASSPYTSFASLADPYDSQTDAETTDAIGLLPGAETDQDDIVGVYRDLSTDILYLRKYDKSGDTWTSPGTTIFTGIAAADNDQVMTYGYTIRHSDNHVLVAALTSTGASAVNDILTADIDTVTPTVTAKTDVLTNAPNLFDVCVMIDKNSSDIYVGYIGGDAGDTFATALGIRYKVSKDGMTTWESAVTLSDNLGHYRNLNCDLVVNGGRWEPMWGVQEGTTVNSFIETNFDNSIALTAVTVALTGTVTASITEQDIRDGGKTVILTVTGDQWVAGGGAFDAIRQDIIDGIDSAQSEGAGWDAVVKAGIGVTDVVRTSNLVVTITLPVFATFDITATETITATVPAVALVASSGGQIASPTFAITALSVDAAITGTIIDGNEEDVRAGSKTIIITLTGDTWVAAGAPFDAERQAIIDGLDSAQSEALGWNNEVRDKEVVGAVVRTSGTVVTITLTAAAAYALTASETITVTVPASALTGASPVVGAPTIVISDVSAILSGSLLVENSERDVRAGGKTLIITLTGATWDATIGADNSKTQDLIDGIDSAQSEGAGWDAIVKAELTFRNVVRTSATIVTITMPGFITYQITANETITVTVPTTALA